MCESGDPTPTHRTFPSPHTACRWCSKSICEAAWRDPRGSGARRTLPAGWTGHCGVPSGHVSGAQDLPQGLSRPPLLLAVFFKCASPFPARCLPGSSAVAFAERGGRVLSAYVRVIPRPCSSVFQYPAHELGFPRIFCCFSPHFEA